MSEVNWKALHAPVLEQFSLTNIPPTIRLPALPVAVMRFTNKADDPDVGMKELANIIETDSGLTAELLRYINSSIVGLRHRATNVQQAISLLGLRQTKLFLITTGIQSAIQSRQSKLMHQAGFWHTSLQKALFAREVARLLKVEPDLAFAGAMLQDFLLPIITNELTDDYINFLERRADLREQLTDYEQEKFGWDHAKAGASLASRWQLPDELICCILFHHWGISILAHPELKRTVVAAVALSALLPDQLMQCEDGFAELLDLQSAWPAFDLESICANVDQHHEEFGMGHGVDHTLSQRLQQSLTLQDQ